jgi:hypothetical protein
MPGITPPKLARLAAIALLTTLASSSTSSCSPSASSPGTPVTDAGMAGCAPLEPGCFVTSGTYTPPSTSATCPTPGSPAKGNADTHCDGVKPTAVSASSCGVMALRDAGGASDSGGDAGASEAGPPPGRCGENGGSYGMTMFGTEADDDDCKYHVSYEATPLCENDGVYFTVKANYLTRSNAPLTGACTFAELCLDDTHPGPPVDSRPPNGSQQVVEGPPGTYTIGPVQFDAPGEWTVRFHFNEICCDVASGSPHGHAAFFVDVP